MAKQTRETNFLLVSGPCFMPTAGKPYVRFASWGFLSIALCLGDLLLRWGAEISSGVGSGWGGGGAC